MNKFILGLLLSLLCIAGCSAPQRQQTALISSSTKPDSTVLSADFTDSSAQVGTVYDFFGVSVRTERAGPKHNHATFGRRSKVNTVRMLGGWYNQDLSGDTYQWDGNKFIYNFDAATQRIDKWLNSDWDIFQIVLDNPPWAFQRGYTFVDKPDGKHYLKKDRVGVYGNGLPPADTKAWHLYIQDFMKHLVATYGKEQVLKWRFRIGSEIDTRPQHWSATRQEFFDHYQNTVSAVRSVLPSAVVGTHFREASHKSKYVDYTGKKENAYAPHFIAWAKKNNVPYDFLAISYYPHITHPHEMDMEEVYREQIAPIVEHPDYNPGASFEIHEYKFIVKMKRAGFVSVATSHGSAFFAMLSKMMLEKNIKEIFQWGTVAGGSYNPEAMTQLALHGMMGNTIYRNQVGGKTLDEGNRVDAIITQRDKDEGIDILAFNFNKKNPEYLQSEPMSLALRVAKPAGTQFHYRVAQIDQSSTIDQRFYNEFPKANLSVKEGGWRKADAHPTASVTDALNEEGQTVYKQNRARYGKINTLQWSEWKSGKTLADGAESSKVEITNPIPSFAVQKYEIRWLMPPE